MDNSSEKIELLCDLVGQLLGAHKELTHEIKGLFYGGPPGQNDWFGMAMEFPPHGTLQGNGISRYFNQAALSGFFYDEIPF